MPRVSHHVHVWDDIVSACTARLFPTIQPPVVTNDEHNAEITADPFPHVRGDGSRLRQVFQNLLENAIDYSGDDPPRIFVTANREDSEWLVSVSDEGIGIDSDDQDRLSDVFQQMQTRNDDHGGTGIELALCERIIKRHGGDIWVESEPGEGTTFAFTLPAVRDSDS